MIFRNVTENVFVMVGPPAYANVTALVLPNRVVLVDCGIQLPVVEEARREIEEIAGHNVDTIILTHFHSDHTRALPAFSNCRVISSKILFRNLRRSGRKPLKGYKLMLPTETFDDESAIQDGDVRLTIKRTGGHTDGSTFVHCPNYRVIVAGDNLWINYFPWGGAKNGDPDLWIAALQNYTSLEVDYFIPGHGPVGSKDDVVGLMDYIQDVRDVMTEMIALGRTKEQVLEAGDKVEYSVSGIAKPSTLKRWYKIWRSRHNARGQSRLSKSL